MGADKWDKLDCYNKVFEAFLKNYELFRYKEDIPKSQSMKAEIASFLNSNTGGMIYLGTDDNGELVQFSSENEKQKI